MISLNPWIAPTKAYAELSGIGFVGIEGSIDGVVIALTGLGAWLGLVNNK